MEERNTRRQLLAQVGLTVATASLAAACGADEPARTLQVRKVLFLGNSITLHGPAPQIGWTGNWGMAASREDLDYVHLLLARMRNAKAAPEAKVRNIAEFERQLDQFPLVEKLQAEWDFQADLVIVAIGENVSPLDSEVSKERYAKAFTALLEEIRKHGHPTILVRGCFWPDASKDEVMKRGSEAAKVGWIEVSDLGRDPANAARAERMIEHAGVAGHPGDRGMQQIADRLWEAIEKQNSLWK